MSPTSNGILRIHQKKKKKKMVFSHKCERKVRMQNIDSKLITGV